MVKPVIKVWEFLNYRFLIKQTSFGTSCSYYLRPHDVETVDIFLSSELWGKFCKNYQINKRLFGCSTPPTHPHPFSISRITNNCNVHENIPASYSLVWALNLWNLSLAIACHWRITSLLLLMIASTDSAWWGPRTTMIQSGLGEAAGRMREWT